MCGDTVGIPIAIYLAHGCHKGKNFHNTVKPAQQLGQSSNSSKYLRHINDVKCYWFNKTVSDLHPYTLPFFQYCEENHRRKSGLRNFH